MAMKTTQPIILSTGTRDTNMFAERRVSFLLLRYLPNLTFYVYMFYEHAIAKFKR